MSEVAVLSKEEQGKLWGELKQRWGVLKNKEAPEGDKQSAKRRINEIQVTLKLDKTDFTKPYEPKSVLTTQTTVDAKVSTTPQVVNTFRKDLMQEFLNTGVPMALAKAKEVAPDSTTHEQLIIAQAFLKPMGVVFGHLVGNLGRK